MKSPLPNKMLEGMGLDKMNPRERWVSQRYLISAIALIGSADLYNYWMTQKMDGKGVHLFENPEGKGFAVRAPWDEPSYQTEDKNGKKQTIPGGPAYFRPLKSVIEVAEFLADPIKKTSGKVSPVPSIAMEQLFGGYPGENKSVAKRAGEVTSDLLLPMSFNQGVAVAKGQKDPRSMILPFFGMPTSVDRTKKNNNNTRTREKRQLRERRQ